MTKDEEAGQSSETEPSGIWAFLNLEQRKRRLNDLWFKKPLAKDDQAE